MAVLGPLTYILGIYTELQPYASKTFLFVFDVQGRRAGIRDGKAKGQVSDIRQPAAASLRTGHE